MKTLTEDHIEKPLSKVCIQCQCVKMRGIKKLIHNDALKHFKNYNINKKIMKVQNGVKNILGIRINYIHYKIEINRIRRLGMFDRVKTENV